MEITIDEAIANLSMYSVDDLGNACICTWYNGIAENMETSFKLAIETMHKYQQLQADYESRLKADMVAMLTDIQLEIQEYSGCSCLCSDGIVDDIDDVIQQKIDALRGKV
jgi:hypothetical protein